jgi:hypothetical protein
MTERVHIAQADAGVIEKGIQVLSSNPSSEYLGSHAGIVWLNTADNQFYRESGGSAVGLEADVDLSGYAAIDHTHSQYAALSHSHQVADVTDFDPADYALASHTHSAGGGVSETTSNPNIQFVAENGGSGPSVPAYFTKVGSIVALRLSSGHVATPSSPSTWVGAASAIPSGMEPTAPLYIPVYIRDDGNEVTTPGVLRLHPDRSIRVYKDITQSVNFGTGGNAGILNSAMVTWSVN